MSNHWDFLTARYIDVKHDGDQHCFRGALIAKGLSELLRDLDRRLLYLKHEEALQSDELPIASRIKRGGKWYWRRPDNAPESNCKYCEQQIFWVRTPKSKSSICLDADGTCHFETCPERNPSDGHRHR